MLPMVNSASPAIDRQLAPDDIRQRPIEELQTPNTMKNAISVAAPHWGWRSGWAPIEGSAGRYMSMAKGPTAVMRPNATARRKK